MPLWDIKSVYDIVKATLDIGGIVFFSNESEIMSANWNVSFLDSLGILCYLDVSETAVY